MYKLITLIKTGITNYCENLALFENYVASKNILGLPSASCLNHNPHKSTPISLNYLSNNLFI